MSSNQHLLLFHLKTILIFLIIFLTVQAVKNLEPVTDDAARAYLEKYGYLTDKNDFTIKALRLSKNADTNFKLRQSIIKFQKMGGLNVSGILDYETRRKMAEPRCGVPDIRPIISGVSALKWNKRTITYKIESYTNDIPLSTIRQAIQEAFNVWAAVTSLTFTQVTVNADISIRFARYAHGDTSPFDGPGNVLAHATLPSSGSIGFVHFDDDESWTYKDTCKLTNLDYMDFLTVAAHEIGHVLGLEHSSDSSALMAPYYKNPVDSSGRYNEPRLSVDDIRKIQALYGPNRHDLFTGPSWSPWGATDHSWTSWLPWSFWSPWPQRNEWENVSPTLWKQLSNLKWNGIFPNYSDRFGSLVLQN